VEVVRRRQNKETAERKPYQRTIYGFHDTTVDIDVQEHFLEIQLSSWFVTANYA